MFCAFFYEIPKEDYQMIEIRHNDVMYSLSKDLCMKYSSFLSTKLKNSECNSIVIDYDYEYDEFDLISDLFNYKRVFITQANIDFLEFVADYLGINILINKTKKFRSQYQNIFQNPVCDKIKKIYRQIFSISSYPNGTNESNTSIDEYEDDNLKNNSNIIIDIANKSQKSFIISNDKYKNTCIYYNNDKNNKNSLFFDIYKNDEQKIFIDINKNPDDHKNEINIDNFNDKSNEKSKNDDKYIIDDHDNADKSGESIQNKSTINIDIYRDENGCMCIDIDKENISFLCGMDIEIFDDEEGNICIDINRQNGIPRIYYDPNYITTAAHLMIAAIMAHPYDVNHYLQIIKNDHFLLSKVTEISKSGALMYSFFDTLKIKLYHGKEKEEEEEEEEESHSFRSKRRLFTNLFLSNTYSDRAKLDTGLLAYLREIASSFDQFINVEDSLAIFLNTIKTDDVDLYQQLFLSHSNVVNNINCFNVLFIMCASFASMKCLKFMLLNSSSYHRRFRINKEHVRFALAGGNIEIFRMLLDKYDGSPVDFINDAILFHQNKILKWIVCNYVLFLSLYNTCCSRVLYGTTYIKQRWYKCKKCHIPSNHGCCHYCAKHCHADNEKHSLQNMGIHFSCFCDDECELSQNIELVGDKTFVEIDDLILLSVFCANLGALKILVNEGAYIKKCRDDVTQKQYTLNDDKLCKLMMSVVDIKEKENEIPMNFQ
ncbi:hypothetical protein M9Y10_006485 [Tritrichomonas musculus]|uniref:UBR-type domain-containing protein n=1 Tax=Tritrichomonas musculus TaxID=1915356 RepID=A0ABR2JEB2_9EUKA